MCIRDRVRIINRFKEQRGKFKAGAAFVGKKAKKQFRKSILEKKGISGREKGTRRALGALGISRLKPRTAGRPEGTYKHGMPIQQYRKVLAQQRAAFRQQRQRELMMLKRRGFSEEQVNRLQLARTLEQQNRAIVPDSRRQMMQQAVAIADEEKDFTRFRAQKTVSPNLSLIHI